MPAQCSHLLHQLNSCPKWWLIRDKTGTSSAVSVLQLQHICKGNSDRQVVLTFGRRSKEHYNFVISGLYLPNVEGTGENIWVFVTLTYYKYREIHARTLWCFWDFKDCKIILNYAFYFSPHGTELQFRSQLFKTLWQNWISIRKLLWQYFCQKKKRFLNITFADSHILYRFSLAQVLQKSLLYSVTLAVQVKWWSIQPSMTGYSAALLDVRVRIQIQISDVPAWESWSLER